MKKQSATTTDPELLGVLAALKRASRNARKLAVATGTPFYVVKNGRIVNLNAGARKRVIHTVLQ